VTPKAELEDGFSNQPILCPSIEGNFGSVREVYIIVPKMGGPRIIKAKKRVPWRTTEPRDRPKRIGL